MILAAVAGLTLTAAGYAMKPPPAVGGVYMGLRTNMEGRVYPDYYTFFPDGKAIRGLPVEGLGHPVDWTETCRNSECGTYTASGSRVVFRRNSGSEQAFNVDAQGVLRKPNSSQGFRRMHVLNGVRLNGTYGILTPDGDTAWALTLRADGRFRERGLMRQIVGQWDARHTREGGTGTYVISRGTLTLSYAGGVTEHHLLVVPPGVSPAGTPPSVQLRYIRAERLP